MTPRGSQGAPEDSETTEDAKVGDEETAIETPLDGPPAAPLPDEEPEINDAPPARELIEGPVIVRNISESARTWPDITTATGHTLQLKSGGEDILNQDPGEVAHLQIRSVDTGGQ